MNKKGKISEEELIELKRSVELSVKLETYRDLENMPRKGDSVAAYKYLSRAYS